MKSLSALTKAEAEKLTGLLFDLDDTFLEHTQLTRDAYNALFDLKEKGLRLIALTGRPASWGEMIVRMWPIDAAIVENGSLAYVFEDRTPVLLDTVSADERQLRRERLSDLVAEVRRALPELVPANDVQGRISDFTFDIGENEKAEESTIQRAIELSESRGARTTRSSVHLHLTFDRMDKGSGAALFLMRLGYDATQLRRTFAFIGDSENDAAAFAAFATTIGVANLGGRFSLTPRYTTDLPKSAGFCQLAYHLIEKRRS